MGLSKWIGTKQGIFIVLLVLLAVLPLILNDFHTNLLGRYLAFAILVIGLDLVWGYTGILSLGHGIFFGLGAYIMAIYVTTESSGGALPDFMMWSGMTELPFLWELLSNPVAAILLGILLPMAIASLLGFFTFRNRIKGVYFTILTQALVLVTVTLIVSQQRYTGGSDGLSGLSTMFGFSLSSPQTQLFLYFLTLVVLAAVFYFCFKLVNSRFGKVLIAIRDGENRLRFSGYNTAYYKMVVFTLSAGIAGLAGMLYVLQIRIITPTMIDIIPSIEMALWVAIGGRGTLLGPIFGAILANVGTTFFSENYPELWTYFIGLVFIVVIVFLPGGLMSIGNKLKRKRRGSDHEEAEQQAGSAADKHS
ncbi:urea ABC transporter membrane protein [Sinobaca qinghaiensis]|uniref:Urea ABC transporter membrane protein n=1 Tax=Sinobaca qinghaiensis TaxID=342944 RepID=A0A419V034_9BACL|nr:urea ABC transporter permease subunit UrtC [Sinobaca qinghaiensis]RKD71230.1 urea ABC transporter membrane protein [Sinobaca qinghaiensis]